MELTPDQWHARFVQQARWTRQIRHYLLNKASIDAASRILEIGCGTGALFLDLITDSNQYKIGSTKQILGLDISRTNLNVAQQLASWSILIEGDAHHLPFSDSCIDVTYCHFLLLWVKDPIKVVKEMRRITYPGGFVLALAEPDYGGRIDFPEELDTIGEFQRQALYSQGADPLLGRKLRAIFHQAGLEDVETGILAGNWQGMSNKAERDYEWLIIKYDLNGEISDGKLKSLRLVDDAAWESGIRTLFVPTFYASGRVPSNSLSIGHGGKSINRQ